MHIPTITILILIITITTPSKPTTLTKPPLHLQPQTPPPPPSILAQNTLHQPTSKPSKEQLSPYSRFYNQSHPKLRPLVILLFVLWITFLFSFVGIVASDFFCPNLSTISSRLNLSESLAGVSKYVYLSWTARCHNHLAQVLSDLLFHLFGLGRNPKTTFTEALLGFGNGAPDVFSTFAAFKADTGSLAIGELIGASLFIVSVVVGTMSIVRPFRVPRHSFLRDLVFFIIAIIFVLIIIVDRGISPWQANALVLIYLTYVLSVLLSSWSVKRIQSRRDQLRIARSHYSQDDQFLEPYHDDPDFPIQPTPEDSHQSPLAGRISEEDHGSTTNRSSPQLSPLSQARPPQSRQKSSSTISSHSDSFKSLLETSYPISGPVGNRRMRAPSISYQSDFTGPPPINLLNSNPLFTTSNSPNLSRGHLHRSHSNESPEAAMTTPDISKRRPRSNTIMINGPIRPSLLGAVEFRDVVNSLTRDSTVHGTTRTVSPHLTHRRRSSSRHPRAGSVNVEILRGNHSNSSADPTHRIPCIHQPPTSSDHRINQLRDFRLESQTQSSNEPRTLGHRRKSRSDDFRSTNQVPNSRGLEFSPHSRSDPQVNQEERGRQSDVSRSDSNTRKPQVDDRFQSSSSVPHNCQPAPTSPPPLPSILITNDRQENIQLPDTPTIDAPHDQHQIHPPNARLDARQLTTPASRSQQDQKRRNECMKMVGTIWKTLFPTLKDLRMKSKLGIFLAIFSAPAVFVLTLTLPVVVDEAADNVGLQRDDEEEQVDDEEGMNDIKVSHDDATRSGLFSSFLLNQNHGHGHPHEEEVGLGLGCVIEEDEDSRINGGDATPTKICSDPGPENDRELQSTFVVEGTGEDEEGGCILREEVQETGNDDEREMYSNQDIPRILATIQTFLAPSFWVICLFDHHDHHHINPSRADSGLSDSTKLFETVQAALPGSASHTFWIELSTSFLIGSVLSKIVFETLKSKDERRPFDNVSEDENSLITRLKSMTMVTRLNIKKMTKIGLCLIGFINSMVYILLIVNQLIEILKFFATIFHISDSILGLTIFGIGNSLGDFVANFTVAKMGFPVMAISACFGGPMLNILLGIGVSARLVISSTAKLNEMNSSDSSMVERKSAIKIESSTSLFISTVGLLIILITMLVLIPLKKSFLFDRSVGFSLILSYSFVFVINVLVEIFF